MTAPASAIYQGRLTHARRGPTRHLFGYRLHMLYLDLDEVEARLPIGILRRGRFGWLSFCRADYLGDPAKALKDEILTLVEARLGRRPAGPVRLLAQVRSFGYVFNPVSVYYCFAADGETLEAIVAEITNTPWQERHAYVLPAASGAVRAAFPDADRSVRAHANADNSMRKTARMARSSRHGWDPARTSRDALSAPQSATPRCCPRLHPHAGRRPGTAR